MVIAADCVNQQALLDNLKSRQPRAQRSEGILKDDLHLPAQRADLLLLPALDVAVVEFDGAFAGHQPQECLTQGGLARTGFADDADGLSRADAERNSIDCFYMAHGAAQQTALDGKVDLEVLGADDFGRGLVDRSRFSLGLGS